MKTKLPTEWQELSEQLGFQEFTPIQTQLFDPILAGETLLGVSPTGTGKTLAYHVCKCCNFLSHGMSCLLYREMNVISFMVCENGRADMLNRI